MKNLLPHRLGFEARILIVDVGMPLDVFLHAACLLCLEESAGILIAIHLPQFFVGVFEVIVALVALIVHADAGTIAVVVFRAVALAICHIVATLTALAAFLFLLVVCDDLLNVFSPSFLSADARHAIPPTLPMLAVPTIYNQSVILSLRMRQYVQHMSFAHVIYRPLVVEVAGLSFLDVHSPVILNMPYQTNASVNALKTVPNANPSSFVCFTHLDL